MGAAQSRPVVVRCDNTLSRLPPHEFIARMKQFCLRIARICDDYLGRSLNAIVYHAILAYIQKHRRLARNGKEILAELVADVTVRLEGFITDIRKLRETVTRMEIIVKHTGPASILEQLSANPICRHILSAMGCSTMMVGGAITTFKEVIGQECWRNEKLTDFFTRLERHLIDTFKDFAVVSTSQIELEGQLIDLRVQILKDPDFEKEEGLSEVAMVIKKVLLDIKLDKLKALATPNVRGA
jgi:hypothetical protein